MSWEVLLADGSYRNSREHTWEDVPDGVLVLWYWGPRFNGVNWGDGLYGRPDTLRNAGMVSDERWSEVEELIRTPREAPSGEARAWPR